MRVKLGGKVTGASQTEGPIKNEIKVQSFESVRF